MDEQDEVKKRRGRPPKSAEDRKGGNLTFRVRDGMRERLEASANARGVSISEDVEKRLERTFDLDYVMGGGPTALVLRAIGSAIHAIEAATGRRWTEDAAAQDEARTVALCMLEAVLKPIPDTGTDDAGNSVLLDAEEKSGLIGMRLDRQIAALHKLKGEWEQRTIGLRQPRK